MRAAFNRITDPVLQPDLHDAVKTVLKSSDLGMSQLSYVEPLSVTSDGQRRVLESRFGGVSFRLIQSTLKSGHAGSELFAAEGHKSLKQLALQFHRHPAASMRKTNPYKYAQLDKDQPR